MIRSLAPVRSAVPLRRWRKARAQALFRDLFPTYVPWLCRSGTDALAAALVLAKKRKQVRAAEAIVPAYGCPDLVAACEAAGVTARLVDISQDSWAYDELALDAALSSDTVALLAVNLLGLGDAAEHLAGVAQRASAMLIQDSAQHLPGGHSAPLIADAIVLSFGRGKPVNAMGGGALLTSSSFAEINDRELVHAPSTMGSLRDAVIGSRALSAVFNVATLPVAYGMTVRMPGLGIGETRYSPLDSIVGLREGAWRRIGPAVHDYLGRRGTFSLWKSVERSFHELGIEMVATPNGGVPDRMLRLPLLARDRAHRDRLVSALQRCGVGATAMYGVPLNLIDGVPSYVRAQGPFAHAAKFADRFFTLPTHECVTAADVQRALQCMASLEA